MSLSMQKVNDYKKFYIIACFAAFVRNDMEGIDSLMKYGCPFNPMSEDIQHINCRMYENSECCPYSDDVYNDSLHRSYVYCLRYIRGTNI